MTVGVAIIGSGFGGIGAAIRLQRAGIKDFVILERASDLGGTWRDNTYPGCRCDVPSNLYSFSFALNPGWTNSYSYQPEIWAYLRKVAQQNNLLPLMRFDHDVSDISFNDETQTWRLTTSQGPVEARSVILATGGLAEPRMPDIDGINDFAGPILHTGRWDSSVDLANQRVAVIGTGASAIQLVPQIAGEVAHLDVYQRSAPWVLPHTGHVVRERSKWLYRLVPGTQRLVRSATYWLRELMVLGFVKDPSRMTKAEQQARDHLQAQIADPSLREKLTPNYRLGCKRVLISDDYYPALTRDNVDLVTTPIRSIEAGGVRTSDGELHPCDVLVAATGFYVTDNPIGQKVHGEGGVVLADAFRGDLTNYKGTMFPGFPNLFMLVGPNTALGHSSMVFMIESQLNYAVDALATITSQGALVSPTPQAAEAWTTLLHEKLPSTVWGTGCASWYLNDKGENTTIWPDFTFKFRKATRHFDPADHLIEH